MEENNKPNEKKTLISILWENPINTIKEIGKDEENKHYKTALILLVIWMFTGTIQYIITNPTFELIKVLNAVLGPVLKVLAMAIAFCIINNRAKDSISKILTPITLAYIPLIVSSLLWLLQNIFVDLIYLLTPISALLRVISVILMYHTVKILAEEENEEKALKTFIKVEAVFYIIVFIVSFFEISI